MSNIERVPFFIKRIKDKAESEKAAGKKWTSFWIMEPNQLEIVEGVRALGYEIEQCESESKNLWVIWLDP